MMIEISSSIFGNNKIAYFFTQNEKCYFIDNESTLYIAQEIALWNMNEK